MGPRTRYRHPWHWLALAALGAALVGAWPTSAPVVTHAASARAVAAQPLSAARKAWAHARFMQLPLRFERNTGQAARGVRFLAHAGSYDLALTDRAVTLNLSAPAPAVLPTGRPGVPVAAPRLGRGAEVRLAFVGAAAHPRLQGLGRLRGTSNYFLGNNPALWHTDVSTYAQVAYHGLYRGIDLLYYGRQGRLEYDFRVQPGAQPGLIRLDVSGARVRLDRQGNLLLVAGKQVVRQARPVAYQVIGGRRHAVAAGYVLTGQVVRLRLGAYDRRYALVIDPVLLFSTYLGGGSTDEGAGIAVDSAGNVFVTGLTYSGDFPTVSPMQSSNHGAYDVYVSKLSADGSTLLYSTFVGGGGSDEPNHNCLALDPAGNVYVTGYTDSGNFPLVNALQSWNGASYHSFIFKLSMAGNRLIYSTYLGGSSNDQAGGIAADAAGDTYVTGWTESGDFPTTANAVQRAYHGGWEAYVSKLSPDGSTLLYSTYLGGSSNDYGEGIAIDAAGDAYVTGQTYSTDYPVTANALQPSNRGSSNAFVSKLSPDGSTLLYSTFVGGSGSDYANGIAVDGAGDMYIAGAANDNSYPTVNAVQYYNANCCNYDEIASEINYSGTAFIYSTYLGGSGNEYAQAIAVDSAGNTYITGYSTSGNFPLAHAIQLVERGSYNVTVSVIGAGGGTLPFSTYLGGSSYDVGQGIAVDKAGSIYVTGYTYDGDFPVTYYAYQQSNHGNYDAFVTKYGLPTPTNTPSGSLHGRPIQPRPTPTP